MLRQPVRVLSADAQGLRAARTRALDRGLRPAVFTAELFATPGDEQNRVAVRAVPATIWSWSGWGCTGRAPPSTR